MQLDSAFQGRKALVTGGSSGIGLALAKQLLLHGADVTLIARRAEPLQKAKEQLTSIADGRRIDTLSVDVSNEEAVNETVGSYVAEHGADVLINNAGVVMPGRFVDLPTSEFRQMMDINFFGAVHMCKATLDGLKRGASDSRPAYIANVSSLAGYIGIYGYTAYAASKFALRGFSEALRAEIGPDHVHVSVVFPADTDTPQLAFENEHKPKETKAIAGTVKPMTADEVAEATLKGMAKQRFEIIPGLSAQGSAIAQRLIPGVVRMFCDSAQRRA